MRGAGRVSTVRYALPGAGSRHAAMVSARSTVLNESMTWLEGSLGGIP